MSSQPNQEVASEWSAGGETNSSFPTPEASHEPGVTRPSVATVLETVLDLREQELTTYDAIRADPGVSIKELATRIDRDRSNINRSVTKLESVGLITRHRRILDNGGYFYANYAAPPDVLTEIVDSAFEEWIAKARSSVNNRCWDEPLSPTTES